MTASGRIRVGIVGASPERGWASLAHIPALKALPGFEISAVCTTRQESAERAAKHFGIRHAFADPMKLARHPEVDVVAVTVKVPDHLGPVMAALAAGKHVYCEWPLGRNTVEATEMLEAARAAGVRHVVGLQGQVAPAINYARDLVNQGYIGRPLAATLLQSAGNWGATLDRAYQAVHANGANMLTITCGHAIDALCYILGEFAEISAFAVSQRDSIPLEATGEPIPMDVPDQIAISGIAASGAVVSLQVRGGMRRGLPFQFEIHGESGDLRLTSPVSVQRGEIAVMGAQGRGTPYVEMPVPAHYRWVPEGEWSEAAYNVAQLYVKLGEAIHGDGVVNPGFDAAVTRHRLIDKIETASRTGHRQKG